MKNIKVLLLTALCLPVFANAQNKHSKTSHPHASKPKEQKEQTVRGISYDYFKASVSDFADSTKTPVTDTAWTLWKTEKWADLEKFFTRDNLNGGWPPARGAVNMKIVTLSTGLLVDRYGGYYDADSVFQDKGTFVSPKSVPYAQRALPDGTQNKPYRVYKITKPIPNVKEGQIIPWFSQPGLGTQYELPYTVNDLKKEGYLQEEKQ